MTSWHYQIITLLHLQFQLICCNHRPIVKKSLNLAIPPIWLYLPLTMPGLVSDLFLLYNRIILITYSILFEILFDFCNKHLWVNQCGARSRFSVCKINREISLLKIMSHKTMTLFNYSYWLCLWQWKHKVRIIIIDECMIDIYTLNYSLA